MYYIISKEGFPIIIRDKIIRFQNQEIAKKILVELNSSEYKIVDKIPFSKRDDKFIDWEDKVCFSKD